MDKLNSLLAFKYFSFVLIALFVILSWFFINPLFRKFNELRIMDNAYNIKLEQRELEKELIDKLARLKSKDISFLGIDQSNKVLLSIVDSLTSNNGIKLESFNPEFSIFSQAKKGKVKVGGDEVSFYSIVASGHYWNLLKFLHELEMNYKSGRIRNTMFYMEKSSQGITKQLFCKILIQKINPK